MGSNNLITIEQLQAALDSGTVQQVNRPPVISGAAFPPVTVDPVAGAAVASSFGLETDLASTQLAGQMPVYRLQPLPPSGDAQTVSATQSVIKNVVSPNSSTSGTPEIKLEVPAEFTPDTQTVELPGPLVLAWAPELYGTVFTPGPAAGISVYLDAVDSAESASATIALSATARSADLSIILLQGGQLAYSSSLTTPAGYTVINSGGNGLFAMALVPAGMVGISSSYGPTGTVASAGIMALFSYTASGLPTVLQLGSTGGTVSNGSTCSGTVISGTTFLLATVTGGEASTAPPGGYAGVTSVTDTNGNGWVGIGTVAQVASAGILDNAAIVSMFICANPVLGSTTFTLNLPGTSGFAAGEFAVYSLTGLGPAEGIPSFMSFKELLTNSFFYQTVQAAGSSLPQQSNLNFLAPISVVNDSGNSSSDVSVPDYTPDSGSGGVAGLVPAPPAGAGAGGYILTNSGWAAPSGGGGTVPVVNLGFTGSARPTSASGLADIFGVMGIGTNGTFTGLAAGNTQSPCFSEFHAGATGTAYGAWHGNGGTNVFQYGIGVMQWSCRCVLLTSTSNVLQYLGMFPFTTGFGSTFAVSTLTASTQGAYFRYDTSVPDTHWQCVTSDGSTLNVQSSGVTPDTNSHLFSIVLSNTQALFYIDYTLVATSSAHLPANGVNWGWSATFSKSSGTGDNFGISQVWMIQ
jgi:hypothetical protein